MKAVPPTPRQKHDHDAGETVVRDVKKLRGSSSLSTLDVIACVGTIKSCLIPNEPPNLSLSSPLTTTEASYGDTIGDRTLSKPDNGINALPETGAKTCEQQNNDSNNLISSSNSPVIQQQSSIILDIETAVSVVLSSYKNCTGDDKDSFVQEEVLQPVQNEKDDKKDSTNDDNKSNGQKVVVIFRSGNAGDASLLAEMYRNASSSSSATEREISSSNDDVDIKFNSTNNNSEINNNNSIATDLGSGSGSNHEESSAMELRIASGFGDEQTPPAIHAIIADVFVSDAKKEPRSSSSCTFSVPETKRQRQQQQKTLNTNDNQTKTRSDNGSDIMKEQHGKKEIPTQKPQQHHITKNQHHVAAACMFSAEWDPTLESQILVVQLCHVNKPWIFDGLLERRILLRLSAIGLLTGCRSMRLGCS